MKLRATKKLMDWWSDNGWERGEVKAWGYIDSGGYLTPQCLNAWKNQPWQTVEAVSLALIANGYAEALYTVSELASATNAMLDGTPLYVSTGKLETMGISIDDMREVGWSDEEMVKQGWQKFRDVPPGCIEFVDYTDEQVDILNAERATGLAQDASGCSNTTATLVSALLSRDAAGRAEYGTSLDRTDLSFGDWCQHLIEELLDAAGYAQRMKETHGVQTVDLRVDASDALAALPQMQAVLEAVDHVLRARVGNTGPFLGGNLDDAITKLRIAATALELDAAGD